MNQTVEQYQSNESEDRRRSIWSEVVSVGKKVLTAGGVVSSALLLVPPLVVASTIAFLSSVPFCFFLANYACTRKLMSSLLPATDEVGGAEKDESEFEYSKIGRGEGAAEVGESELFMAMNEPIPVQIKDDEVIAKESTSLIEKIRDEDKTDRETSEKEIQDGEKSGDAKSEKVPDQPGKQKEPETGHEGELGATTIETSRGKDDEETYSNEPIDQASEPRGTGEEKQKNTTKKKKKTGRAGNRFLKFMG